MPSTPLRGWPYPAEYEDPYWVTIVGTFTAQDTDVNTVITEVRPVARGGTGQSTLTSGSYLKGAGTSAVALQAAPIPVGDGGTGATSFTAGAYLRGNATGAFTAQATPIPVAHGGTGRATLTATAFLLGDGTNAVQMLTPPIPVGSGGTGATSLTGYVKGNGTSPFTTQAPPIPVADGGTGATSLAGAGLVTGSGATSQVGVFSGTSTLAGSPGLTWTDPSGLTIAGVTGTPTLAVQVHRGSAAAPSALQLNDTAGWIGLGGYHAGGAYASQISIYGYATEAWTATARGCDFGIEVTPNGTTAPQWVFWISNNYTTFFRTLAGGGTRLVYCDNGGIISGTQIPLLVQNGGTGAGTFPAGYALFGQGTSPISSSPYIRLNVTNYGIFTSNMTPGQVPACLITGNSGGATREVALHLDRTYSVYNASLDITFGRQGSGDINSVVSLIRSTLVEGEYGTLNFHCVHAGQQPPVSVLSLDGYAYASGRATINAWEGVGLRINHPSGAGVDRRCAILMDRTYDAVGDSTDIVWGGGTGDTGGRLAAIRAYVVGGGEGSLIFYAQSASGDAYSYQTLRLDGSGATYFPRALGGAGTRLVYCTNDGLIAGTALPLLVQNGGTGATSLTGYVKGNGTGAFTAQATPIPLADYRGARVLASGIMSTQNGTGETNLHSYTIPAGTLGPGYAVHVTYVGGFAPNANSKTIRFIWAGTGGDYAYTMNPDHPAPIGGAWRIDAMIIVTGGGYAHVHTRMTHSTTVMSQSLTGASNSEASPIDVRVTGYGQPGEITLYSTHIMITHGG
jgi:hypothetical protein